MKILVDTCTSFSTCPMLVHPPSFSQKGCRVISNDRTHCERDRMSQQNLLKRISKIHFRFVRNEFENESRAKRLTRREEKMNDDDVHFTISNYVCTYVSGKYQAQATNWEWAWASRIALVSVSDCDCEWRLNILLLRFIKISIYKTSDCASNGIIPWYDDQSVSFGMQNEHTQLYEMEDILPRNDSKSWCRFRLVCWTLQQCGRCASCPKFCHTNSARVR